MMPYFSILLALLVLVHGHPVLETNPFLQKDNVSPAPKLSPRTDVVAADTILIKRDIIPLSCDNGLRFCESWCAGPGGNTLFWTCASGIGKSRLRSVPCADLICIPRFLGDQNDEPFYGCGGKAACVSIARLVSIFAKSGATTCQGLNAPDYGKQVKVVSRMYDTASLEKNVKSPKAPDQIILSDGNNQELQRVGDADEKDGIFISKPFHYIGGVKECVRLAPYEFDTTIFSAISSI
ncbi:hypothetical protein IWZ03DRAFT_385026 [Phyllosticta citriasiana]|uniref:Secreted protein n=1 Tax=Phyllosticta citriasiana TaxID=595635 RepID=A0ABR1KEG3_9PEZI